MNPTEELAALLRPAGAGLYLVSTGAQAQRDLQKTLYGVETEQAITAAFRANLEKLASAKACIVAVPSDVGAGFRRGANLGPQEIRIALERQFPGWSARAAAHGIVDVGDVFVVPQLLDDDMLADAQRHISQDALYPTIPVSARRTLPVAPLSILDRALALIFAINPNIVPLVLGGDHSVAWPVFRQLHRQRVALGEGARVGIVQPDAHTDLLPHRLGVKICFATWSYHANELLGRGQRLVQVGTRASRMPKEHWEQTLDVKQFWAEQCRREPAQTIAEIIKHLDARGLDRVYFSNDIDGTDAEFADATGTPEPLGLSPEFVNQLIAALGTRIVAADVVEVAPSLAANAETTVNLAADYFARSAEAALGVVLRS